jgi:hypothetical protein
MNKGTIDKLWVGALVGVLGAFIGFCLFGIGFALFNGITFSYFLDSVFFGVSDFQSRIVTFSMLIDVVLFFCFYPKKITKSFAKDYWPSSCFQ